MLGHCQIKPRAAYISGRVINAMQGHGAGPNTNLRGEQTLPGKYQKQHSQARGNVYVHMYMMQCFFPPFGDGALANFQAQLL